MGILLCTNVCILEMRLVILMTSFQCKVSMRNNIGSRILAWIIKKLPEEYIYVYSGSMYLYIYILEVCSFKICMLESRINENLLNC